MDYNDTAIAAEYDNCHARFRDYEREARLVMERLDLQQGHRVIDPGCGTGAFAIPAARIAGRSTPDISSSHAGKVRGKGQGCRST